MVPRLDSGRPGRLGMSSGHVLLGLSVTTVQALLLTTPGERTLRVSNFTGAPGELPMEAARTLNMILAMFKQPPLDNGGST